jgi:hypothetical protein
MGWSYCFKHLAMAWLLVMLSCILIQMQSLYTVKSPIRCESHHCIVHCDQYWGWVLYATMVWMHCEWLSHNSQRNHDCMLKVPEIEVHRSMNGESWIQWLGIGISPYSDSKLRSAKPSFLNLSFQDCHTLNSTLDGNHFTKCIFYYTYRQPKYTIS